jgi:hypothetical protein
LCKDHAAASVSPVKTALPTSFSGQILSPTNARKCAADNCARFAFTGGFCKEHTPKSPIKTVAGVQVVATKCCATGCTHFAFKDGLCKEHKAGEGATSPKSALATSASGMPIATATAKKCAHENCNKFSFKNGFCKDHVKDAEAAGDAAKAAPAIVLGANGQPVATTATKKCSQDACSKFTFRDGLCKDHFQAQAASSKAATPSSPTAAVASKCKQAGCNRFAFRDGICKEHNKTAESAKSGAALWGGDHKGIVTASKCKEAGCNHFAFRDGVCKNHYKEEAKTITKLATTANGQPVVTAVTKKCQHENCPKFAFHAGFCKDHAKDSVVTAVAATSSPTARCNEAGCTHHAFKDQKCRDHWKPTNTGPAVSENSPSTTSEPLPPATATTS